MAGLHSLACFVYFLQPRGYQSTDADGVLVGNPLVHFVA